MLAPELSALPGILLLGAGRNVRQQRRRSQIDCRCDLAQADLGQGVASAADQAPEAPPTRRPKTRRPGIRISDLH